MRDQRHLCRAPEARQRGPQVVRHVVERAAHRRHEPFDPVEHGVEQARQLVDRVAGSAAGERDALVGPAGADDARHRAHEAADRLDGGACHDEAAGERHDDDRQRDEAERRAKPRQQRFARVGALPHLHQRAVGQPERGGLQLLEVPALGLAQHDRLRPPIDDADKQAFGRGALLGLHGLGERAKPSPRIGRGVVTQLGVEDLPIALRQRRGGQPVGQGDNEHRSADKQRRVPEGQTQAECREEGAPRPALAGRHGSALST